MKKLIYPGKCLAVLALAILAGCKKDKVAFPTAATSNGTYPDFSYNTPYIPVFSNADGVLAAVQAHNYHIVTISPYEQDYEYGIAKFASATGNFGVLVDADSVWLNSVNCAKGSNFLYMSTAFNNITSLALSGTVHWKVKGTGGMPAEDTTFGAGAPSYSYPFSKWDTESWQPLVAKDTTGITDAATLASDHSYNYKINYTIYANKTTSTFTATTTNADSLQVIFSDGAGYFWKKTIGPTDSLALRPVDFYGMPSYNASTLTMQVNAIKYANAMIGSTTKHYYFLRMASYTKYWKSS